MPRRVTEAADGRPSSTSALGRLAVLALLWLTVALVLVPAAVPAQTRAGTPEVIGVRVGLNDATTRIVIDVDGPARFATRVLAAPPRLAVELESVRWRVRERPQGTPTGLVRSMTYGNLDAGRARLVLEIAEPFRIVRQERLPPSGSIRHHRILIDVVALSTTTRPAQVDAAGTTRSAAPPVAQAARSPAAAPSGDDGSDGTAVIAGPPVARPGTAPASPAAPAGPSEDVLAAVDAILNPAAGPANATNGDHPTAADAVDGDAAAIPVAVPALRPPAPAAPERRVIALDPGHGGADPGTIGINGVYEKAVTLDVARRLRDLIEASGRYEVVMTRDSDTFVSLRDRIATARRANAALFISIHADSLGDANFRGASVYTLSDQASDSEAALLAAKENRADIIAGTDLSAHDEIVAGILIDLAQRITNNRSIEFADVLTNELGAVTTLVRNTRRFAGFVVLKSPDVPSVLLELGYLSNPRDAANLADPAYRDRLAQATVRAIDRYFAVFDAGL